MIVERIAIYGGGGFAREVARLVQSCRNADIDYQPICFIDDDPLLQGRMVNGLPTMSLAEARNRFPDARLISAIGSPRVREQTTTKAEAAGFRFATMIHPRVEKSE